MILYQLPREISIFQISMIVGPGIAISVLQKNSQWQKALDLFQDYQAAGRGSWWVGRIPVVPFPTRLSWILDMFQWSISNFTTKNVELLASKILSYILFLCQACLSSVWTRIHKPIYIHNNMNTPKKSLGVNPSKSSHLIFRCHPPRVLRCPTVQASEALLQRSTMRLWGRPVQAPHWMP